MLLGVNSLLKTTADAATMTAKIGDKLNDLGLTNDAINAKIDDVFRKKRVLTSADVTERIKDSSWVSHSMMTRSLEYEAGDDMLRFFSSADLKFEDTSLGGNYVINPRPQFTRYADPRAKGIMSGVSDVSVAEDKGRFGMGHYYAEAIDDTHQTIHMRFGMPEFNSMLGYVRNFFNNGLNRLATRGRVTPGISDFLYYGSKLIVGWSFKALHLIEYALKTVTSFTVNYEVEILEVSPTKFKVTATDLSSFDKVGRDPAHKNDILLFMKEKWIERDKVQIIVDDAMKRDAKLKALGIGE